ncbi:hypothetical protein M9H77_05943 [Catharanthus roseus]|uniref:Uncharacterized protein n=1 Tax=Catharanthus roseus TaxID=4058 RepID=A0ACC0BQQ4_CATRO|nr:hypothetical protein M9H77_05943 [Catharanthus roseus]
MINQFMKETEVSVVNHFEIVLMINLQRKMDLKNFIEEKEKVLISLGFALALHLVFQLGNKPIHKLYAENHIPFPTSDHYPGQRQGSERKIGSYKRNDCGMESALL